MAGTLPHCTGTGTQQDPYIFTTEQGLKEALDVNEGVYIEAGAENLVFDVNNGVLNNTFYFKGLSFKGKGLTIRNLNILFQSSSLISVTRASGVIEGVNFYNMYMSINSGYTSYFINLHPVDSYNSFTFKNCNFSGVCYCENGTAYVTYHYRYSTNFLFKDCTFNINFKYTANDTAFLLWDYDKGITYNNCTFCFSGTIVYPSSARTYLYLTANYPKLINCTFANSQSNPLIVGSTDNPNGVMMYAELHDNSTQNYYKMYTTYGGPSGSLPDKTFSVSQTGGAQFLINKSRMIGFETLSNGIKMQETNPSGSDYIYSATNLAAKGFTVGTEVT